ncbi:MAG TPA: luciferase family protein [Candidatus Limnocylindria bacterium]|nr:luciferase family protein [Candidatus Limnocylindria bacterium]
MARGARLRGVSTRKSRFGGHHTTALWHREREIAHCHDDQADVRLGRAVVKQLRDELSADARIDLRRPGTDWILVRLRRTADVERALELLRVAMRANTIRR